MGTDIARLRTFRDDAARARGDTDRATASSTTPQEKVAPPAAPPTRTVAPARERATTPKPTTPDAPPVPRPSAPQQRAPQNVRPTPAAQPNAASGLAASLAADVRSLRSPQQSILGDDTPLGTIATRDLERTGTIVTDTKRKRFRLFPAMYEALRNWLFEKKEDFESSREPTHMVAPAERRKEVIEQAAGGSALAPRDDYQHVRERLRHVPRTRSSNAIELRKASEVPAPSWTHTTDGQRTSEPAQQTTPHDADTPAPQPPKPAAVPKPEPAAPPTTEPAPEPPLTDTKVPPAPVTPQPAPQPTRVPRPQFAPTTAAPQRRSYITIAIVGVIAVVLGVGTTLWFFGGGARDDAPVVRTDVGTTFIDASANEPVALGESHRALMQSLAAAHDAASRSSITEFYPVTAGGAEPASHEEIMQVFTPTAPGSFLRTITAIGFGTYRDAPYLVLKVTSFDTALGGMLAWEPTIVADLAPFFGTEPATNERFTDIVHANRDVRVLTDASGNDRIAYSFLNRSTILISVDRIAIEDLAPLIR